MFEIRSLLQEVSRSRRQLPNGHLLPRPELEAEAGVGEGAFVKDTKSVFLLVRELEEAHAYTLTEIRELLEAAFLQLPLLMRFFVCTRLVSIGTKCGVSYPR